MLTQGRLEDQTPPPNLLPEDLEALASRTGDLPLQPPTTLPARQPKLARARHAETSVYPYLETNVDSLAMSFSQETIPEQRSALSVSKHGSDTPFRSHAVIRGYVESLVTRNGYEQLVSYNTSVELAEKIGNEWRLVLRKDGDVRGEDEWWEEWFDAVVVASGHFNVPYIPKIEGLEALERAHPGSVKHSKMFRGREGYKDKVSCELRHQGAFELRIRAAATGGTKSQQLSKESSLVGVSRLSGGMLPWFCSLLAIQKRRGSLQGVQDATPTCWGSVVT